MKRAVHGARLVGGIERPGQRAEARNQIVKRRGAKIVEGGFE